MATSGESMRDALERSLDEAMTPDDWPGDPGDVFEGDDERVGARDAWEITDDGGAVWAMRRARRARREIEQAEALAEQQIEQVRAWLGSVSVVHEREIRFFEGKLRRYFETMVEPELGGKHSYKLPTGTLKSRAGGVSVVVDPPAVAWLREHDREALRFPDPEPVAAVLKAKYGGLISEEAGTVAAVTADGEVVPGVAFERRERGFSVEYVEEI